MPKDRRTRSLSFERNIHAPYPCGSSSHHKSSSSSSRRSHEPAASDAEIKEWEEARCPVCMDHPHNAVLLLCSSHDKGCRAYMCDTSYRHSNCLDQFRKASSSSVASQESKGEKDESLSLSCPLCRGMVKDWTVVEAARRYMNAKPRICSLESCEYSGAYGELRKHARLEHPSVRPSDADPERQRDWRRMEWQRDIGDLISTIQPFFADERDAAAGGSGDEVGRPVYVSHRLYISLFVRIPSLEDAGDAQTHPQVIISFAPRNEPASAGNRRRRSLPHWGEIFDGVPGSSGDAACDDDDEDNSPPVEVLSSAASRRARSRRRRRMRMLDDEDIL